MYFVYIFVSSKNGKPYYPEHNAYTIFPIQKNLLIDQDFFMSNMELYIYITISRRIMEAEPLNPIPLIPQTNRLIKEKFFSNALLTLHLILGQQKWWFIFPNII
jgi:hypothetical protein